MEPVVLVPGLLASPRYFAAQLPVLWPFGAVSVANHTGHDSMAALARDILATAPPRFALLGHSMGGYIAFEILRQAGDRVTRLALLDTSARADTPEQTENRRRQIAIAQAGRFAELPDLQYPNYVHPSRHSDAGLRALIRAMAEDNGAEAFVRQQTAIIGRIDSRPTLATISCPTLVLVGDADQPTPPARAQEIAAGIAGSKLVVVPQSGHMTPLERPAEVVAALRDWMRT